MFKFAPAKFKFRVKSIKILLNKEDIEEERRQEEERRKWYMWYLALLILREN